MLGNGTPLSPLSINLESPSEELDVVPARLNVYSRVRASDGAPSPGAGGGRQRHGSGGGPRRAGGLLGGLKEMMGGAAHRERAGSAHAGELADARRAAVARARDQLTDGSRLAAGSALDLRRASTPNSSASDAFKIMRKTSRPYSVQVLGVLDDFNNPYAQYLSLLTCYDLAPVNGAVILIDQQNTVHRAFLALLDAAERAALVWDSNAQLVVGALTQTDFLQMLCFEHDRAASSADDEPLHERRVSWWLARRAGKERSPFVDAPAGRFHSLLAVDAESNLLKTTSLLCERHVRRVPVHEPRSRDVIYVLTLKRVLFSIHKQIRNALPPWMLLNAQEAGVGTWRDLVTVTKSTRLLEAVRLLLGRGLSSLPVVNAQYQCTDALTKFDVLDLLASAPDRQAAYGELLGRSVGDALAARQDAIGRDSWHAFCLSSDTLVTVVDKLVAKDFKCILALSAEGRLEAAISISDVIRYLVMRQHSPVKKQKTEPRNDQDD